MASTRRHPASDPARPDGTPVRPYGVTALLCVAQFVVVLDVTIVAIALPAVRADLGFGVTGLQWVVSAYTLAFGGLLLTAGRAGDLYGHRRLFTTGLAVFGAASLACGLAPSAGVLLVARAVQGAGAAAIAPAALALLGAAFPPGRERRRAVAWWTASAACGGAGGWMLGGLLAEGPGWRWVFLVNVPIAVAAAVLARPLLRETARAPGDGLDVPGTVTVTVALALLIHGTGLLPEHGVTPPAAGETAGAALLMAVFFRIEHRTRRPLLPPAVLRRSPLRTAVAVAAALTAATTPAMFFAVLYEQEMLGHGPLRAGLRCAPFNAAVIAGSALGPRLLARAGPRLSMSVGLWLVAGGAAVLLATGTADAYGRVVLPAFVLMGAGLGAASVASTVSGCGEESRSGPGLAAGLLTTAAQLGGVLGLALLVGLAAARTAAGSGPAIAGYHAVYGGAALIAALGGAFLLVRRAGPVRVAVPAARSETGTAGAGETGRR